MPIGYIIKEILENTFDISDCYPPLGELMTALFS